MFFLRSKRLMERMTGVVGVHGRGSILSPVGEVGLEGEVLMQG